MRLRVCAAVVLALAGHGAASAATDYVYRLDGVEELTVHVEGTAAVVDIPSIDAMSNLTQQLGVEFRPQRMIYDARSHRAVMLDLERKKMFAITPELALQIKRQLVRRMWETGREQLAAMPPDEREKLERLRAQILSGPSPVTQFAPSKGQRPTVMGVACDEIDYDSGAKATGTACLVPWAELLKRPHTRTAMIEAEAVFGVLASLELFNLHFETIAVPGLVAELKTPPGPNAHSLVLLRIAKVAERRRLFDTKGFTDALPFPPGMFADEHDHPAAANPSPWRYRNLPPPQTLTAPSLRWGPANKVTTEPRSPFLHLPPPAKEGVIIAPPIRPRPEQE